MSDELTLRIAAMSSEYAAHSLLVVAQALAAGYGDHVDELGEMQPHTFEWDFKIAELRRLVDSNDDWQRSMTMLH